MSFWLLLIRFSQGQARAVALHFIILVFNPLKEHMASWTGLCIDVGTEKWFFSCKTGMDIRENSEDQGWTICFAHGTLAWECFHNFAWGYFRFFKLSRICSKFLTWPSSIEIRYGLCYITSGTEFRFLLLSKARYLFRCTLIAEKVSTGSVRSDTWRCRSHWHPCRGLRFQKGNFIIRATFCIYRRYNQFCNHKLRWKYLY
jgi:hypothetical protein